MDHFWTFRDNSKTMKVMAKDTPKKYFEDQYDDEEVLYVFRKHPVVMRKGLVFASFGMLLGMIPVYIKPEISVFIGGIIGGIVLAFLIFFPFWVAWHFSVFIMTDQRFIQVSQKGFFHKSVVDIALSQIQMVNYEVAGIQETLLGFGTIMVQTYVGDLAIHDVHHPSKVQKKMLHILREYSGMGAAPFQATDQPSTTE